MIPKPILALLVAGLAVAGCFEAADTPPASDDDGPAATADAGLGILLLGDTGTGEEGQHRVAAAAHALCETRGCDVTLLLGDNIYETGVDSPTDPQWFTKFEEPYANFTIPFYAVIGNHDDGGSGFGYEPERGDHQVAYAARTDRAVDIFRMPARYYDVRVGDVHLFGLDTNTIVFGGVLGAKDPGVVAQESWLVDALASSDAQWKFAFAHMPYITNGQHGNLVAPDTASVRLRQFYEDSVCGEVDLVIAGHDHDLQWLKPVAACGDTEFIVSGAGAKMRPLGDPDRHEAWFQQGDTLGFAWLHVNGDTLTGAFYDDSGALLYERVVER